MTINTDSYPYRRLCEACLEILKVLGEDIQRDGLRGTPDRFARAWLEFRDFNPGNVDTTFESFSTNQMVIVSGVKLWSICEHHLLPFWCDISIGYIARDKVLGLSKFGRVAQKHAHKLQIQERLVSDIGNEIVELTRSPDVAVIGQGEHLCMTMRGIKIPSLMTSSFMSGCFYDDPATRQEFLQLCRRIT